MSLNRPGGNLTGVSCFSGALGAKQLEIIREMIPSPGPLGLLIRPDNPTAQSERADVQTAAAAIGQAIEVLNASSSADLEAAFAALAQRHGARTDREICRGGFETRPYMNLDPSTTLGPLFAALHTIAHGPLQMPGSPASVSAIGASSATNSKRG
jgi:hypothetical protein